MRNYTIPLHPETGACTAVDAGARLPDGTAAALHGIPVFPSSVLINNVEVAARMLEILGDKTVCVLRGHSIVVAGETVEEATVQHAKLETLARVAWDLVKAGVRVLDLPEKDILALSARVRPVPGFIQWNLAHNCVRALETGARPTTEDLTLGLKRL